MTAKPEKKLHHVSVEVPRIVLYDDLKKKIAEIRVKRDSLMLAHSVVNLYQDRYNKFIYGLESNVRRECVRLYRRSTGDTRRG